MRLEKESVTAIGRVAPLKRKIVHSVNDDAFGGAAYYALVSHRELDGLVARLMQMYELNGDVEQRNALKNETKNRSREWLDSLYEEAGYDRWTGVQEGITMVIEDTQE